MQQVERNDIGGDRHEDESYRAFAGGRIIFLGIDPQENGPAAFLRDCQALAGIWGETSKPCPHVERLMGHDSRNEASLMT